MYNYPCFELVKNKWMVNESVHSFSTYDLEGPFDKVIETLKKELNYYTEQSNNKELDVRYYNGKINSDEKRERQYKSLSSNKFIYVDGAEWKKEKGGFDSFEISWETDCELDRSGNFIIVGVRELIPEEVRIRAEEEQEDKEKAIEKKMEEYLKLKSEFEKE